MKNVLTAFGLFRSQIVCYAEAAFSRRHSWVSLLTELAQHASLSYDRACLAEVSQKFGPLEPPIDNEVKHLFYQGLDLVKVIYLYDVAPDFSRVLAYGRLRNSKNLSHLVLFEIALLYKFLCHESLDSWNYRFYCDFAGDYQEVCSPIAIFYCGKIYKHDVCHIDYDVCHDGSREDHLFKSPLLSPRTVMTYV
jgi:hypothetical protein